MIVKLNLKILTDAPQSLSLWLMVFICVIQKVKRQLVLLLFIQMFVTHNYLPHRPKYSRGYSVILCVFAYSMTWGALTAQSPVISIMSNEIF